MSWSHRIWTLIVRTFLVNLRESRGCTRPFSVCFCEVRSWISGEGKGGVCMCVRARGEGDLVPCKSEPGDGKVRLMLCE